MWSASRVTLVVLSAALVGQAGRMGDLAPYVLGGVLLVVNVALWQWPRFQRSGEPAGPEAFIGPLVACWLITSILPVHSFARRSSSEAVATAGFQALLELVVFLAVGLLAMAVIRAFEPTLDRSQPPWILFLLPIWVMASSAWSPFGPYAFVRGWQMAVIGLLAWATIALARVDPEIVETILGLYLRWFVRISLGLVALGVAFGGIYVSVAAANASRFHWIGAHPNGAGLVLSVALVVSVAAPGRVLQVPPAVQGAIVVVFTAAMYKNHSRAAWLCVALGLLVAFALRGRVTPLLRTAGVPLLGAAVVLAIQFRGPEIWDYILRNRDADSLAGGHGRRALWGMGFRALDTAFDWIFGLGYGVTRTMFLAEAPWAGHAHNSVLGLLVGVGLIGVALFFVLLGHTLWNLAADRTWTQTTYGIPVTSLLVLVVVNGLAADVLAEPTIGFVIVYLIASYALVHRLPRDPALGPEDPEESEASGGDTEPAGTRGAGRPAVHRTIVR